MFLHHSSDGYNSWNILVLSIGTTTKNIANHQIKACALNQCVILCANTMHICMLFSLFVLVAGGEFITLPPAQTVGTLKFLTYYILNNFPKNLSFIL